MANGTFTEKQCLGEGCVFCESHAFKQDECLPLEGGGSAFATCTGSALNQKIYKESTTCTGASQTQSLPLNKCLKDSQGSYFEVLCSAAVSAVGAKLRML
jgi:hypothetical protein